MWAGQQKKKLVVLNQIFLSCSSSFDFVIVIQDLLKLGEYLPLLFNLVHDADKIKDVSGLKIRWSSGLISQTLIQRKCPKFFQVDNIMFELGMVIYFYALKLRERAMELVSTG